ncbi:MAG: metal-dependent hydrolase family protein [Pseudohaliea sp.]
MSSLLIKHATVFDGESGDLVENGSVYVEDGTIKEFSDSELQLSADRVIDAGGRTLMPGLIDLHVHIAAADLDTTALSQAPSEYLAMFAAGFVQASLQRGFTCLRDAGGTDAGYAMAFERGFVQAPRFYLTGRFISQTGGHGDFRSPREQDFVTCACHAPAMARFTAIADGADEVRKAVRGEFRRGSKAVKLMCSGGVASPTDPLLPLQFTDEEIRAAVHEAEVRGSYVMAHCHSDAAIRRAAELGIRSIEHASMASPETAAFLAEKGVYAVPTLSVARALTDDGAALGLPQASQDKLRGFYEATLQGLENLVNAGVKLGFGTDLLAGQHHRQGMEFVLRAELEPPLQVLRSATSLAGEILQEKGRLGVIAAGAYADLILVDGNPLDDISLLSRGEETISVIVRNGELIRDRVTA